ncbi:MAG TPA: GNAT family N-acetyltransferase [Selenomonadales bacterium]|nr:GNAT family N-acetyltransferase [Selenomonadales bacterium]
MEDKGVIYRELPAEELEALRPLWDKLREHHEVISELFRPTFRTITFDQRKQRLLTGGKQLKIIVAETAEAGGAVGYCIASLDGRKGEIDSLFVAGEYRGRGIGAEFMARSLHWLREHSADAIHIEVLAENEPALGFYAKFGFVPRTCVLQQRPE